MIVVKSNIQRNACMQKLREYYKKNITSVVVLGKPIPTCKILLQNIILLIKIINMEIKEIGGTKTNKRYKVIEIFLQL